MATGPLRVLARVVITRNGVPAAVLISPADLAALEATLDVLSDPDAMERLRQSREDVARGDIYRRR